MGSGLKLSQKKMFAWTAMVLTYLYIQSKDTA